MGGQLGYPHGAVAGGKGEERYELVGGKPVDGRSRPQIGQQPAGGMGADGFGPPAGRAGPVGAEAGAGGEVGEEGDSRARLQGAVVEPLLDVGPVAPAARLRAA